MNIKKEHVIHWVGTGLIVVVALLAYDQIVKPMINSASVSKPTATA